MTAARKLGAPARPQCRSAARDCASMNAWGWQQYKLDSGERIKHIRQSADVSTDELAAAIGMSQQAIMKYERGETVPPPETMRKIAYALRCCVVDLMPERAHFHE